MNDSTKNEGSTEVALADRPRHQITEVMDAIPLFDTSRFAQMEKIARIMANSSLIPEALYMEGTKDDKKPMPFDAVASNCFLVVNQAVRWGLDPFAVAQCVSVVHGRLCYEGKLIAAVLDAKLGVKLHFAFNNEKGDAYGVKISRVNQDGSINEHDYVEGTVGDWKTTGTNSAWGKPSSHRRMLIYRGTREWTRIYESAIMLGVYSDDEMADLYEDARARRATPVGSGVAARLASTTKPGNGFSRDHVAREIGDKVDRKTGEVSISQSAGETQQANTGGTDENVNASHSGTDAATKESAALDEGTRSGASAPQDGGDKPQKQSNADAGADAPNEERGSPDKNAKTSDGGKQPSTDFEQADDVIETEGDLVDASARGEAETAMPGSAGSASTSQESDSSSSSGSAVSAGDKGRAGATPDAGASSQQPSGKSSVFQKYADKMNAAKSVDGLKGAHRKFRDTEIWPDENQKRQVLGKIFSTCEGRLNEKISAKDARETLIELIGEGEQLP